MDRIKQSLFDWLGQDLTGLVVADACAGSGSFAFEAASRGANVVHACEPDANAFATLSSNHAELGHPAQVVLHRASFQLVLPTLNGLDLIFADPPFPWYGQEPQRIVELMGLSAAALAPRGSLLIRGEKGASLPVIPTLREAERRQYGRSWVALLRA